MLPPPDHPTQTPDFDFGPGPPARAWGRERARESGFDRKNFIRKLVRDIPVKRNSYNEFVHWLNGYKSEHQT
jgi:hypothetical protein